MLESIHELLLVVGTPRELLLVVVGTPRELLPSAKTKVRIIEGGINNLPDDNSHRASNEIVSLLSSLTADDLVLALISGKH